RLERSITVEPGDLLLLKLVSNRHGGDFQRVLFSKDDYPQKPFEEQQQWRLAALQNQQLGERGLQLLATLEKNPDPRETTLQLIKPRETWMELRAEPESRARFALRWNAVNDYPAPAWVLDVPEWPVLAGTQTPATPLLQVWWNPDQETAAAAALDRGADFRTLTQLRQKTVQVDGDKVVIESVQVEEHLVASRRDRKLEKTSCLVVRLSHAPDRPVWVRLQGLDAAGQEHRFYTEANKYTALFWPVTEEQANKIL